MNRHKLGIIVPFRNRHEQLEIFLMEMTKYLLDKDIRYEIYVIEQDDAKQFNRGMLLNIGFVYAEKFKCDYVIFHDIDMLPVEVDYSYSDIPLHMATDFIMDDDEKNREIFDEYFGGVTLFPVEIFRKINGYSNKYWGWGYEDNDLLLRCKINNVVLKTNRLENCGRKGKTIKFNGIDSYVECKNILNTNQNSTFLITFYPEELSMDHNKDSDEYTAFSIPGWDFAICYSSFNRYNFCAFDNEYKSFYINTKIKPRYKTCMVIVLDNNDNIIKVYQDGNLIGTTEIFKKLYFYKKEPNFYLGVGRPDRKEIPNFFKGTISTFAYYDDILSDDDIFEISKNKTHSLTKKFGKYTSNRSLKLYYDANVVDEYKLIDLTLRENDGKIINCEIVKEEYDDYVEYLIPIRRKSVFKSLKHEENGFVNNKWRHTATRWNQLRFHNEIEINTELTKEDGLSDLEFVEHLKFRKNNTTLIKVGI